MAAVADHDVADVADSFAVDENSADLDRFGFLRAVGGQFQDIAVFENKAVFFRNADVLGQAAMAHEMAILAVDRHEIARSGQLQHGLELFLARVTGNVDLGNFFVVDFGAAPVQVIDQIGDRFLVAGNELGRKNHGIAGLDLDGLVVVQGDAVQHRKRLALAAGGEKREPIERQILPTIVFGHETARQMQDSPNPPRPGCCESCCGR